MIKDNLLNSINNFREVFNTIVENVPLSDEEIMYKYFSFEETRSSADGVIRTEGLKIRNKATFKELPPELVHFYNSFK